MSFSANFLMKCDAILKNEVIKSHITSYFVRKFSKNDILMVISKSKLILCRLKKINFFEKNFRGFAIIDGSTDLAFTQYGFLKNAIMSPPPLKSLLQFLYHYDSIVIIYMSQPAWAYSPFFLKNTLPST